MAKKATRKPKAKAAAKPEASDLPQSLETPNKSAAIKTYFAEHPQARNKEVIEALKGQGIEVSTNYVSIIKSKATIKPAAKRGPKPGSKRWAKPNTNGHYPGGKTLTLAAELYRSAGSITAAEQALSLVKHVTDVLGA